MKTVGDVILAIGDRITVLCYTLKYWCRGDDWKNSVIVAKNIVETGWK